MVGEGAGMTRADKIAQKAIVAAGDGEGALKQYGVWAGGNWRWWREEAAASEQCQCFYGWVLGS